MSQDFLYSKVEILCIHRSIEDRHRIQVQALSQDIQDFHFRSTILPSLLSKVLSFCSHILQDIQDFHFRSTILPSLLSKVPSFCSHIQETLWLWLLVQLCWSLVPMCWSLVPMCLLLVQLCWSLVPMCWSLV